MLMNNRELRWQTHMTVKHSLLGSEEAEIIVLGLSSSDWPIQLYVTETSGIRFKIHL